MAILDDLPTLHGGAAALREALAAGPQRRVLTGLKGSSLPLLLARLDRELEDDPRPWVLLTSLGAEAEGLAEDLRTFGATGVEHFPELEILPFDRHSADRNLVARRVEVLDALERGEVRFLCTSVRAWLRKVPPPELLAERRFTLRPGLDLDLDGLAARLEALGYRKVGLVTEPGDFAVKGGIVEEVAVTFGLRDELAERVEVSGGIAAGDTVLTGGALGTPLGASVRVTRADN